MLAGYQVHLSKPVDPAELTAALAMWPVEPVAAPLWRLLLPTSPATWAVRQHATTDAQDEATRDVAWSRTVGKRPDSGASRGCRWSRADNLPAAIEPMLAVSANLPDDPDNWAFEYKWDGVRCMSFWNGRELRLLIRNHKLITQRYPELEPFGRRRSAEIFDGEIIALDAAGHPSFGELQQRMHVDHPTPELIRRTPIWYVVFDVLYARSRLLLERPYNQRREILESTLIAGDTWHISPSHVGQGKAMLESARKNCMEGVVAKLLSSAYLPGRRSPAWRKIKIVFGQEFVIGGWIPEKGDRLDRVGRFSGLRPGAGGGKDVLRYAGRVGTGFDALTHATLVSSWLR